MFLRQIPSQFHTLFLTKYPTLPLTSTTFAPTHVHRLIRSPVMLSVSPFLIVKRNLQGGIPAGRATSLMVVPDKGGENVPPSTPRIYLAYLSELKLNLNEAYCPSGPASIASLSLLVAILVNLLPCIPSIVSYNQSSTVSFSCALALTSFNPPSSRHTYNLLSNLTEYLREREVPSVTFPMFCVHGCREAPIYPRQFLKYYHLRPTFKSFRPCVLNIPNTSTGMYLAADRTQLYTRPVYHHACSVPPIQGASIRGHLSKCPHLRPTFDSRVYNIPTGLSCLCIEHCSVCHLFTNVCMAADINTFYPRPFCQ